MRTPRRIMRLAGLLLLAACGLGAGCAYRVAPPRQPEEPVSAFIVDYGYHSSLVLPRGEGDGTEYAYGEFEWYARNRAELLRAPGVVLTPSAGTLGRRDLGFEATLSNLRAGLRGTEEILELRVSRARAEELLAQLDARFEASGEAPERNALVGMSFVHDPEEYWAFNNCNGAVAGWLRRLDCRVSGTAIGTDFRVVRGRGRD